MCIAAGFVLIRIMPDPVDPAAPPPPPVPGPEGTARPATTDLPSNVAAALACFPLIGGIIFYLLEKRDGFVRFYAMVASIICLPALSIFSDV